MAKAIFRLMGATSVISAIALVSMCVVILVHIEEKMNSLAKEEQEAKEAKRPEKELAKNSSTSSVLLKPPPTPQDMRNVNAFNTTIPLVASGMPGMNSSTASEPTVPSLFLPTQMTGAVIEAIPTGPVIPVVNNDATIPATATAPTPLPTFPITNNATVPAVPFEVLNDAHTPVTPILHPVQPQIPGTQPLPSTNPSAAGVNSQTTVIFVTNAKVPDVKVKGKDKSKAKETNIKKTVATGIVNVATSILNKKDGKAGDVKPVIKAAVANVTRAIGGKRPKRSTIEKKLKKEKDDAAKELRKRRKCLQRGALLVSFGICLGLFQFVIASMSFCIKDVGRSSCLIGGCWLGANAIGIVAGLGLVYFSWSAGRECTCWLAEASIVWLPLGHILEGIVAANVLFLFVCARALKRNRSSARA